MTCETKQGSRSSCSPPSVRSAMSSLSIRSPDLLTNASFIFAGADQGWSCRRREQPGHWTLGA